MITASSEMIFEKYCVVDGWGRGGGIWGDSTDTLMSYTYKLSDFSNNVIGLPSSISLTREGKN